MELKLPATVNWKTTLGAVSGVVGMILVGFAAPSLLGGDASVGDVIADPNFRMFAGILFSGLGTVIAGFFSRDYDKSSQDNEARPTQGEVAAQVKAEIERAFADRLKP